MNENSNPALTGNAQKLRKEMTKEEKRLWYDFLKKLPQTFNRQKVIANYIVDFYCAEAGLVIEVDGAQHYSEEGRAKDAERDSDLGEKGLLVLRYTNSDVKTNFAGVCLDIKKKIAERTGKDQRDQRE